MDRVKIGQSMNVAQRVDSFKFEELIGMKPFLPPARRPDDHPEDHALAVKRELMTANAIQRKGFRFDHRDSRSVGIASDRERQTRECQ